ncbi:MAG TPA: GNAT family N-acetyltransferase [Candidatus Limnocylindria bacterium]|jgi:hypothetical protein|nr:GNAT family N-acetyltransferase [Candidatus Limnocylindria bacterium]
MPESQQEKGKSRIRRIATSLRDARNHQRERRRPTGLGFVFADRVSYLDPQRWDHVVGGQSVFLRRDILQTIERHGPDNIEPRYALIFRDDQAVAAIAAQVVTVSGKQIGAEKKAEAQAKPARLLGRLLGKAAHKSKARLQERMLIAGNLLSWGFHGIAFAKGENPAELWPGIAEALYRIRRAERLTGQTDLVMVKDLTPHQDSVDALRRFSYRPLDTEPNMVLDLDPAWRTYEDYLGALDAKYRRNARDQAKKLTAGGCVIESLENLEPHAKRLHELYLSVHGNASVRLVTLPEAYLPQLARAAGQDFRCSAIRRGEELIGFVTTLRDGATAIAYYIGFDRAAAGEGLPLYLRLLHATIGHGIELGCRRLSLGRTALEPKAALGAKPEPMSVWMRHRVPALNWMLGGLLGAVPHNEAPERNPFKAANSPKA